MIARLLEKLELWIKHRSRRMPYTAYCYWCNAPITAPTEEILEALNAHFDTPAHKAARDRSQ